jgi:hypothetical protein
MRRVSRRTAAVDASGVLPGVHGGNAPNGVSGDSDSAKILCSGSARRSLKMSHLTALSRVPARTLRLLEALRLGEIALGIGLLSLGVVFGLDGLTVERLLGLTWFFAGSGLFVAAVYFLNSYLGYEEDLANRRFDGLGTTDRRFFLWACLPATAGFVGVLGLYSTAVLALALGAYALWGLYSWPAVGIKVHPVLGAGIHFVAQLAHFFMGYLAVARADGTTLLIAVYFSLLFVGAYLHHLVIDYEADARICGPLRVSQQRLGSASLAVFAAAAAYWLALAVGGVVPWWQVTPFAVAFVLQVGARRILAEGGGDTQERRLRYRGAYRVFYGLAVVAVVIAKGTYG